MSFEIADEADLNVDVANSAQRSSDIPETILEVVAPVVCRRAWSKPQ
jgi:hypothetical protein